jgi:hypothetical protein
MQSRNSIELISDNNRIACFSAAFPKVYHEKRHNGDEPNYMYSR